ncbi:MAG TPA: hypothetical protein VF292_03025 [Rhodanobacteraceae bacterium]
MQRLRIFQPTLRPKLLDTGWRYTEEGEKYRSKGRLGQRHFAIVQAAMSLALRKRVVLGSDGLPESIVVTVRLADLRRSIGRAPEKDSGRYNQQTILRQLRDMQTATVELKTHVRGVPHETDGTLLTGFEMIQSAGTRRYAIKLHFGRSFALACGMPLRADDIPRFGEPTRVAHIRNGVTKALAQYVLSHDTDIIGGWFIDDLIKRLTPAKAGSTAIRNRRREVRNSVSELAEMGIELRRDRLRHARRQPLCQNHERADFDVCARASATRSPVVAAVAPSGTGAHSASPLRIEGDTSCR